EAGRDSRRREGRGGHRTRRSGASGSALARPDERGDRSPARGARARRHFANRMNRTIQTIPAETMDALVRYRWPGNIREMQNLVERAVILSPGAVLRVPLEDLRPSPAVDRDDPPRVYRSLADAERAHIL